MDLHAYVRSIGRGAIADIARNEGVSPVTALHWVRGTKPVPLARAPSIESFSRGAVTVEEIAPGAPWVRVKDRRWPHRGGRPVLDFGLAE